MYARITKVFVVSLLAIFIACPRKNIFEKIINDDWSIVATGRYQGKTIFLPDGGDYKTLVDQIRAEISQHKEVLPMVTTHFFPVYNNLTFKFMYGAFDEEKNYLILRYFARIYEHPVYAGFQIQFVYDVNKKNIVTIYTAEVPFE